MISERVKLTRPELKRHRETLARLERYLPTLKLKQRLLQISVTEAEQQVALTRKRLEECLLRESRFGRLTRLPMGLSLERLVTPTQVVTTESNIAGVSIPGLTEVSFPEADYSLVTTPPFVDALVSAVTERRRREIELDVLKEKRDRLYKEFLRVNQRLNLFEKVMIPKTEHAIHLIRIYLGDEQTAAVGRAKLAKAKQVRKREEQSRAATEQGVIH